MTKYRLTLWTDIDFNPLDVQMATVDLKLLLRLLDRPETKCSLDELPLVHERFGR